MMMMITVIIVIIIIAIIIIIVIIIIIITFILREKFQNLTGFSSTWFHPSSPTLISKASITYSVPTTRVWFPTVSRVCRWYLKLLCGPSLSWPVYTGDCHFHLRRQQYIFTLSPSLWFVLSTAQRQVSCSCFRINISSLAYFSK